jgi:hypothetical protein
LGGRRLIQGILSELAALPGAGLSGYRSALLLIWFCMSSNIRSAAVNRPSAIPALLRTRLLQTPSSLCALLQVLICALTHVHHTPDAVAGLHVLEALVDIVERLCVGYELVNPEGSVHIVWRSASNLPGIMPRSSPSTIPGSSVRPLTPPNADPFHVRPVTSWNLHYQRTAQNGV